MATDPDTRHAPEAATPPEKTGPAAGKGAAITKLPQFLDAVIERSGQKRNVAKPVVDALLAILSERIAAGEDLVLPPLGRLKVAKRSEETGVVTLKLRNAGAEGKSAPKRKETLAAPED